MSDADDEARTPITTTSTRLSPAQALAVTRQRLFWKGRAESWDKEGSAGLTKVVESVLADCREQPGAVAVDLGCGSGQITIPLGRSCSRVLAVDVSATATAMLEAKTRGDGVKNIQVLTHPIETLDLQPASVDLVVSNYALHHLRDVDKEQLLLRIFRWLRPGGRLVIGDMMFGRGADPEDRAIIASKVRRLARRGPGGWWRLVKNVWRFAFRLSEKPLPVAAWELIVTQAGFQEVHTTRVVAEACVLSAAKPIADMRTAQSPAAEAGLQA